ncbi:MAG TPA: phosphoribosylanthranilate isomerase [Candidatus Blautia stercoravium]|nr:phosphoribosylanthranilate isomerase [Candidatus Blautia stercoravium]
MSRVKICGLKTVEEIRMVNGLMPDYVGIVFAKSKRQVSFSQAIVMKQALSPKIKSVGVFVNAPKEEVLQAARMGIVDLLQLHGDEDSEYVQYIKAETGLPVIKAIRVRNREDILKGEELPCDYLLLDTYRAGIYGGCGEVFDWKLIPMLKKPFFLAGGLNGENVQKAVSRCCPFAVDVSSAVEEQGRKSEEKVREFLKKVREVQKYE